MPVFTQERFYFSKLGLIQNEFVCFTTFFSMILLQPEILCPIQKSNKVGMIQNFENVLPTLKFIIKYIIQ